MSNSPKAAAKQPVPARETLRLKDPSQFRYVGKGQLKLVDGRDIALSLDSRVQYIAFSALKAAVEKHRAKAGAAIAMTA